MKSTLRLTRAWILGIIRDRGTLFWLFAFPALFVVIFGLAFGQESIGPFRVGLVADEATPEGLALAQAFGDIDVLDASRGSLDSELAALRDGDRYAVVAVAPAPAAASGAATATEVVVYVDPSRSTAAQIVQPIVRQVIGGVNQRLAGAPPALVVEERSVRSTDLRFVDYFLPGVIGFSIMQAGMFAAIPFVQLRVTRVLKRFAATPLSRGAVIASQAVTRLLMAMVQTAVLLLIGRLLFDVHIGNNIPGMVLFVLLGGLAFLCLGLAVSGLARTEESVPALVQAVSFPMMFLAGVFWPIENFPGPVQAVSRVLPLNFLGDGLRQVMVGGAALDPLWVDYLVLAGWAQGAGLLAGRLVKWE